MSEVKGEEEVGEQAHAIALAVIIQQAAGRIMHAAEHKNPIDFYGEVTWLYAWLGEVDVP